MGIYQQQKKVVDPVTGEEHIVTVPTWYGRYRNAEGKVVRVALSTNKRSAQKKLVELEEEVQRIKAGFAHSAEKEMVKDIKIHLADFEKSLKSRTNTERHVTDTMKKVRACTKACKWSKPLDIRATDVEQFLVKLRERAEKPVSIETSNHYLRAIKAFCRWMHLNKRVIENPLTALQLLNNRTDRRHDRRALSGEELLRLLKAAAGGPPVEGIWGVDREMMYIVAAWTGFRKGEIGSLTIENFHFGDTEGPAQELVRSGNVATLDIAPPTVTIEAAYSKHRRDDSQFMHPDLVARMAAWLRTKNPKPGELLFPVSKRSGGAERKTGKMMQVDLDNAREEWIAETVDDDEVKRRRASDFLAYVDKKGRFADFHCLRHTFITNLGRANVPIKMAQTLARHSDIKLTMNIYTHVDAEAKVAAIQTLPSLPAPTLQVISFDEATQAETVTPAPKTPPHKHRPRDKKTS